VRLVELARDSIRSYLATGEIMKVPENLGAESERRAGVFVSLHEADELRGCIGTIVPMQENLAREVIENAVSAATRDPRFEPVKPEEVPSLEISVDVLGEPVLVTDLSTLDPKKYGVIATATGGRQGVLLPDLEGVDSAAEQIRICREKGGIGPDEPVEIYKFEVERFEE